ncbi:hypothetical protein FOZ62_002516, partial [Perkinsus olseni]
TSVKEGSTGLYGISSSQPVGSVWENLMLPSRGGWSAHRLSSIEWKFLRKRLKWQ